MGFLSKLFRTNKCPPKPYVDAGVQLMHKLIQSLNLDGWQNLLPVYSREEIGAIDSGMSNFQNIANDVLGGEARFHPEAIELIQRQQIAQALEDLAGEGWRFTDKSELPKDWKGRVSTYLKAWASRLNPICLTEIADILTRAGYKTEARDVLEVVLLFPTYAHVFYGGAENTSENTGRIVSDAQQALQNL